MAQQQQDFEIKVEVATGGKVLKIKQLTGITVWDPMFGGSYGSSDAFRGRTVSERNQCRD
jgi:hypothetical protein